eukprot:CAMPEP_0175429904 /NCGR_PEP_ID=MMETSP0095-20121207/51594_1 /TAXON_ID=311494 /ORGANISM="Alexandrium monilatum, Strain CCMP3105" /LENGTH=80 /DNA_ID=CAMNT_0016729359 /DNA_START=29 /DNA_END=267 /DNA_ORIENTATION=+
MAAGMEICTLHSIMTELKKKAVADQPTRTSGSQARLRGRVESRRERLGRDAPHPTRPRPELLPLPVRGASNPDEACKGKP